MARRIRWQLLIAFISAVLVLGLMGYLAITTAAVDRPITGGVFVEAVGPPPLQLNPLVSDPADQTATDLQALIFDGLIRIGPESLPEPGLARAWEADPEGLVYTFTLRTDVTWHDGRPVTIDDVLFTIRAIQSPAYTADPELGEIWRTILVERVDSRRLQLTLQRPYAPLLSAATFPILPAHLLADLPPEAWATSDFNRRPIGCGPYELIDLNGERALLRANPNYPDGRPFLDTLELRFFATLQEQIAGLLRGDVSGTGYVGSRDLRDLSAVQSLKRNEALLDGYTILTFNLRQKPFDDLGFRRALAASLDKDLVLARSLDGNARRLDTPVLHGWWAALDDLAWYPPDLPATAATLDSLGYQLQPDGIRAAPGLSLEFNLLTDTNPDRLAAAAEIARQWELLGIRLTVEPLEPAALLERLQTHEFSMALHGWQRLGADPDSLYHLWHSSAAVSGANYAGLSDDQIDLHLEDARNNPDIVARSLTYATFQRRWVSLVPGIVLYQPLYIYTADATLGGLGFLPREGAPPPILIGRESRYYQVGRWYTQRAREIRGNLRQNP